jgi:signal transduction histidine kinase
MEKHGDNLANIFENLPRAKNLLEELLTVEPMETQAIDLSELARLAVNQQRTESARKSQTLLTEISRESIWVFGNQIQLFRALFNLVENAVKYTPEGRQIEARLHQGAGEAIFEVEDRGRGIPEDAQTDLFKANYRVNSAENEGISGTGMGLHLVQTIVARHGGRIIFRSQPGKGSVFGFALPLHNAEQGSVSQSAG